MNGSGASFKPPRSIAGGFNFNWTNIGFRAEI